MNDSKFTHVYVIDKLEMAQSIYTKPKIKHVYDIHKVITQLLKKYNIIVPNNGGCFSHSIVIGENYNHNMISCYCPYDIIKPGEVLCYDNHVSYILTPSEFVSFYNGLKNWIYHYKFNNYETL